MARFLCCCIFGLFSLSVLTAHAGRTIIVEPGQISPTYSPGQGPYAFSDSRSWEAPVSTQNGSKVNVPVKAVRSVGWTGFRGALKSVLKLNPGKLAASAVVTSAVVGLDWLFENSELKAPNTTPSNPQGNTCYQYAGTCYSSISTLCTKAMQNSPGSKDPSTTVINNVGYCSFVLSNGQGASITIQPSYQPSCPTGSTLSGVSCVSTDQPYRVPTDIDWSNFTGSITSPSDAASIAPYIYDTPASYEQNPPDSFDLTGPASLDLPSVVTTSTSPSTGSTTVTETLPSIQLDYSADPLSVTATPTTVANVYENGTLTNTSTTTTNSTETSVETSSDIPTDCEFMPTVCSFIDWVKTPFNEESPDLSDFIVDDDYEQTVSFSSSSSCPAPYPIETDQGSFSFDWQPACDFASLAKPFVIIAFLIAALYVSLGMGRTD